MAELLRPRQIQFLISCILLDQQVSGRTDPDMRDPDPIWLDQPATKLRPAHRSFQEAFFMYLLWLLI